MNDILHQLVWVVLLYWTGACCSLLLLFWLVIPGYFHPHSLSQHSCDQGYHKLPLPILSSPHIPGLRSHSSSLPAPVRGLLHGNTRSNRYMKHILDELNQPINEGRYFSSCLHSYLSGHTLESQPYKQASHSSSNYPLLSQFDRAPVEVLQYICPHPPFPSRYYSEFVQAQLYSQVSNTHQPFVIHLSPPYPRKWSSRLSSPRFWVCLCISQSLKGVPFVCLPLTKTNPLNLPTYLPSTTTCTQSNKHQ